MMDAIKYFDFFKILSKISRISISSRKRSHIPPWGTPENHRLKSAGWQGICDRSLKGNMSQTLPSFRQLDPPYSLSSPWPGRDLWTSPALPTGQRVSQWWHSLPAALVIVCSQRKIIHLDGWFVFFSSCFHDILGRVRLKNWIFCTWYFKYKDFVSSTLNLYTIPMICILKNHPMLPKKGFLSNLSIFLSVCPGARENYVNIPSGKYIYVHKYVYICVYTYLCKMDEYRYNAGLSKKWMSTGIMLACHKNGWVPALCWLVIKMDEYRYDAGLS